MYFRWDFPSNVAPKIPFNENFKLLRVKMFYEVHTCMFGLYWSRISVLAEVNMYTFLDHDFVWN
jgi:hypothetical protein